MKSIQVSLKKEANKIQSSNYNDFSIPKPVPCGMLNLAFTKDKQMALIRAKKSFKEEISVNLIMFKA